MIKLTDVAALVPGREFKIHGGQISDSHSDVKPGTFKDMLMTKDGLTVAELKRFLRANLRDKSSAELFQDLSRAKQQEKENPQQFMYCLMGLKQRVLFASQQGSSEFQYDNKLVHGVFLHSLYQGISERCI